MLFNFYPISQFNFLILEKYYVNFLLIPQVDFNMRFRVIKISEH